MLIGKRLMLLSCIIAGIDVFYMSHEMPSTLSESEKSFDDVFTLEVSNIFRENLKRLAEYQKRRIDEGDQSLETFYMSDILERLLRDGSLNQAELVDEYIETQGDKLDAAALSRAVADIAECLSKDTKRE